MSDADEFVMISSDNTRGIAANAMSRRIWYAVAQPGEEVDMAVMIAGIALYIAKTADAMIGEPEVYIDEIHKQAKVIFRQFRERRSRGEVQ